ncbi:MAG: zinc ribbon domain-containing protein [Myxococcota bacterium]
MPIYEYLCEKCEHEFEREQRITADPIKTCPECKSRRVKKLISQTSFVLKGGGWYATPIRAILNPPTARPSPTPRKRVAKRAAAKRNQARRSLQSPLPERTRSAFRQPTSEPLIYSRANRMSQLLRSFVLVF